MSAPTSADRNAESPGNPMGAPGVEAQQKHEQEAASDSSTHKLGEDGSGKRHLLGVGGAGQQRHLAGEDGAGQQHQQLGEGGSGQQHQLGEGGSGQQHHQLGEGGSGQQEKQA
jgi:hypothetical protein